MTELTQVALEGDGCSPWETKSIMRSKGASTEQLFFY